MKKKPGLLRRERPPAKEFRFDPGVELSVIHPVSGIKMSLLPAPLVYFSERRLQDLARICNTPDILTMIREGGVQVGDRYTRRHANGFLKYSLEGWEDLTHYVFFLLAPPALSSPSSLPTPLLASLSRVSSERESRLAGCFELRSPARDGFETGYWIAPEFRGVGTAVLNVLLDHARERGVRLVWARVLETNLASRRMLSRAGFSLHPRFREPGVSGAILRYEKKLDFPGA